MSFRAAFLVVLFLLIGTPLRGQDLTISDQSNKSSFQIKTKIELKLEYPRLPHNNQNLISSLYWDSTNPYRYQFEGIPGILVSKLNSYYNRYENRWLESIWEKSNLSLCEYEERIDRLNQRKFSFNSPTRPWFSYLPPEKGGDALETRIIGKEIPFLEIGEFTLCNTGKIRVGNWGVYFRSGNVSLATKTPNFDPYFKSYPGFQTNLPRGNILTTSYCSLSCHQNITIKIDEDYRKIISNAEIAIIFRFYAYNKQWASLTIAGRTSPYEREFTGLFTLELYIF